MRSWLKLLWLLVPLAAQAGDLEDGVAAYSARDYGRAFLLLQPLADQGVAQAQFVVGEMYRHGRGFTRSVPEALPLLRAAAAQKYPDALNALGEMAEAGEGMSPDLNAAREQFQQAAELGSVHAQLNLGLHYIRIEEVRDFALAAQWLEGAAQKNDVEAQYLLGRLLLDGRGRAEDDEQGIKWLLRAAGQGHVAAQRFLFVLRIPDKLERDLALRELKRQLSAGTMQITATATNPDYGFAESSPIKTGPGLEAEWRYLNTLRGPEGQVVHYRALGPCCFFKVDNQLGTDKGFLDRYSLTYEGLDKPAILHITLFETAEVKAPLGFTFAREAEE